MTDYEIQQMIEELTRGDQGTYAFEQEQPTYDQREKKDNQPSYDQVQDIMDQMQGQSAQPSGTTTSSGGGPAVGVGATGEFSGGMGAMGGETSGISGGLGGGQFSGGLSGGGAGGGAGAGGAGGSGGGMAAAAPVAYIAAAIGAQLAASNNTDTVVDGQKTGNVFTGIGDGGWNPSFATEPWLAWGHDKLGWDPTVGEEFDAAVNNSDWDTALKRLPAAADYWADPIRSWVGNDTWSNIGEKVFGDEGVGDVIGFISDPIQGILSKIEDWF